MKHYRIIRETRKWKNNSCIKYFLEKRVFWIWFLHRVFDAKEQIYKYLSWINDDIYIKEYEYIDKF
jgi:hypothetical protein